MSSHSISLTVNGTTHRTEVEARLLLVHYLREQLRLTGTHIGCDTTHCGACTVLLDGKPVKSCTLFTVQADGRSVSTVEGLELGGELHAVQKAFKEEHALQCGFCTPGMVMATIDLLQQTPNPTDEQIRTGLEGNLCRCTGYHNIVKAVKAAAEAMAAQRPEQPGETRVPIHTPIGVPLVQ